MQHDLQLPSILETAYPYTTHVSAPWPVWEPRRFRVLGIRDLVLQPLTIDELIRRPMTRRSRYLIRVFDLDRQVYRSVYHRSMQDYYRETPLRVGVFYGPKLVELMTTNWGPTIADRRGLIKFLGRYQHKRLGRHRIGIFSDDLEVIQ